MSHLGVGVSRDVITYNVAIKMLHLTTEFIFLRVMLFPVHLDRNSSNSGSSFTKKNR